MAYLTRDKRHIVIEIFTSIGVVRQRLLDGGYTFTEADVYANQFWGKRFIVDKPVGKGAQSRINFLVDKVAK